jgi:hypothetical protein
MAEPPRIVFTWNRDEHDPARRAVAIRSAVDFIATFFADEGDGDKRELERLLRDDPEAGLNALYALGAIAAGLVVGDAEASSKDPLDVLRSLEQTLTNTADDNA